jgi:hypothetical protein
MIAHYPLLKLGELRHQLLKGHLRDETIFRRVWLISDGRGRRFGIRGKQASVVRGPGDVTALIHV